jgi:hypothetical protein
MVGTIIILFSIRILSGLFLADIINLTYTTK